MQVSGLSSPKGILRQSLKIRNTKNAFHLEVYISPKDDERQCAFRRSKGETLFTVLVAGSSLASKRSLRTMIMNDVNKGYLNSCLGQFFIALFIPAKD